MSRHESLAACMSSGFPRVSGDEPALEALDSSERAFSPRERG